MEEKIDNLTENVNKLTQGLENLTNLVDHLAINMAKGFEASEQRDEILSNKIDAINNRVDDVAQIKATKEDFKNLDIRVTKIEDKILA
jgi:methyl-accepting chemotaxis protein